MYTTSEELANIELKENHEGVAKGGTDRQTDDNVKQPQQHRRILAGSDFGSLVLFFLITSTREDRLSAFT